MERNPGTAQPTVPAKAAKTRAQPEFALILKITAGRKATYYRLRRHDPHPGVAKKAWRLEQKDGKVYDVALTERGHWSCTCQDFIFRRQNAPEPCKHCAALRAFGLL